MSNVEDIAVSIAKQLSYLDTYDVVEVIANVLISTGINRISMDIPEITPENVVDIIMKDKQQNGETLQNALAQQGLVMIMWLDKIKEK